MVATAIAGLCLVSILIGVVASFAIKLPAADLAYFPAFVAFTIAGWVLAVKRPENIVGFLVLVADFGFMFIPWSVAAEWALRRHIPHAADVLSAGQASFVFDVGGLALLLPLFFPDGRLPSPRRRWRLVVAADIGYMFLASFNLVQPGTLTLSDGRHLASTVAIPSLKPLWSALIGAAAPMLMIGIAGSVCAIATRWRAAGPAQRAQMKWVVITLLLAPPAFILHDIVQSASDAMLAVVLPLVPVSIAVSVLRYRLYDIDRLVSRTVTYVIVTGTLIGVYVGFVALTTSVLSFGSSFGVAASTLAAAALFRPLLRRVQASIDRRFNRSRYDAARTVDAFSLRLRDEVDLTAVRGDLLEVVAHTVQPVHASLWVAS